MLTTLFMYIARWLVEISTACRQFTTTISLQLTAQYTIEGLWKKYGFRKLILLEIEKLFFGYTHRNMLFWTTLLLPRLVSFMAFCFLRI